MDRYLQELDCYTNCITRLRYWEDYKRQFVLARFTALVNVCFICLPSNLMLIECYHSFST